MKYNCIFEHQLYAFILNTNGICEYQRKINEWEDQEYLYDKALEFKIKEEDIDNFFDEIFYDRELLIDSINTNAKEKTLNIIFKNLHEKSTKIEKFEESKLNFREKSPYRPNRLSKLRLYALRIKNDCYFITGGLIKSRQDLSCKDGIIEKKKLKELQKFLITEETNESEIFENILEF